MLKIKHVSPTEHSLIYSFNEPNIKHSPGTFWLIFVRINHLMTEMV